MALCNNSHMDFYQLEVFLSAARHESMSEAAREFDIAQSSASRSIARLEQELGVSLFERSGRNVSLNQYGKSYLAYVARAMEELSSGETVLREMAGKACGHVSVASPAHDLITEPIASFMHTHPDTVFRESFLPFEGIRKELERGNIDFAVSFHPVNHPDFAWEPVAKERLHLLVSNTHPLGERASVSLSELKDERFVVAQTTDMHYFLINLCRRAGFEPDVHVYSGEQQLQGPLVAQGIGLSIIPAILARRIERELQKPITRTVPFKEGYCCRTIGLVSLSNHFFSQAASDFRNEVKAYFTTLDTEMNGAPSVFDSEPDHYRRLDFR